MKKMPELLTNKMGLFLAFLLIIVMPLCASDDNGSPVVSPNGLFTISQTLDGEKGWTSLLTFSGKHVSHFELEPSGIPWAALYSISPDSKWILRIQKTGSGDNVGILYHVESNYRVSMIIGFNDSLWKTSDAHSRLLRQKLYHTGISSNKWFSKSRFLIVTLSGSNADKSGDGIQTNILYNLSKNTFSVSE